jgi:hypothetical protein
MGIGNSQEWSGQQQKRRPSPYGYGNQSGKKKKRGFFRRRKPALTTQPGTSRPLYGPCPSGPRYAYSPVQPIPSPFSYNNYAAPSYMPSQHMMMMMQPQRVPPFMGPPPSMGMPMTPPYVQQPPLQPAYNYNIGASAPMPGGTRFYPSSYPSAPMRLMTDWTGGGKISPGFLGPPI